MTTPDTSPDHLRTLIKDIRFAMLTTRSSDGALNCRPMVTQEEDRDDTLWFFTGKNTHKSTDIIANPQVNVSYSDPASQRYISVCGRAVMVEDRIRIRKWWRPAYAVWFPQGPEDPELALLRITVERIDVWQAPTTWIGRTLAFATALITGDRAEPERSEAVTLYPGGASRNASVT